MAPPYRKHFLPLESNPAVFTRLLHAVGGSKNLAFHDIYSLDLLSHIPRPVYALILVFPTSPAYEQQKAVFEAGREEYNGAGEDEDVMWFRQTIHNACGLYAILHAICNGEGRGFIESGSLLERLIAECTPLAPADRALVLEGSQELEKVYSELAVEGDSAVPENAEDEVEYHYVCFVQSNKSGCVYEMDGDCKGPIIRCLPDEERLDMLAEDVLDVVRSFVHRENGDNLGFNLMALAKGGIEGEL